VANLYGSGDFAVAYIESDGKITARAVCAPERKVHAKTYGDDYRLKKLLTDAGFVDCECRAEKFRGLRLVKAHHWDGFYTDFGGKVVPHPTDDKYLVIA